MPTITRWFKVSHDINADPEMWELRDKFGDRAALVWLECLSIADRNSGVIGPDSDQTRNQLASKCRSSRTKVGLVLDWCRVKVWLISDGHLRVSKWSKYNNTRDAKKLPSETLLSETSETNQTKQTKPIRAARLEGVKKVTILNDAFSAFYTRYPRKVGKQAALRAWQKLNPSPELVETIYQAVETHKHSSQWLKDNGDYIPHPATWLNNRRWEDEIQKQLTREEEDEARMARIDALRRKRKEEASHGR